jgi:hypothetical protein
VIEIVKATPELVKQFVQQGDIREKDAYEWLVLSNGRKLIDALQARDPEQSWAAIDEEGFVLALWGFAPQGRFHDGHFVGWLIGSNKGNLRARELHRKRKAIMAEADSLVDILALTIYRDDKWHAALGFSLLSIHPFPEGMGPSIYVYRRNAKWEH